MYTVLITTNNELIPTVQERIIQKSKLVNKLRFIVYPMYNDIKMDDCDVVLEYILPNTLQYRQKILTKSAELYDNKMLEYVLDIDTDITNESGNVTMWISFIKVFEDNSGEVKQCVRKTTPCLIKIEPINKYSGIVVDDNLSELDQRILNVQLVEKQLEETLNIIDSEKADGLNYENGELQLTSNGNKIGNSVAVGDSVTIEQNEIKVVTF